MPKTPSSVAKRLRLTPPKLRTAMEPTKIAYDNSSEFIKRSARAKVAPPQPRVLQALEHAMRITDRGYNVYLCGEANMGRTYLLQQFMAPWSMERPTPPDLLYVNNFQDQDKPRLLELPSGEGRDFKEKLGAALAKIRKEVPNRYETEAYVKRRNALLDTYQSVREKLLDQMENQAADEGFNLDVDDQGALTLYPLIEGKLLSEEEFERLDPELRQKLKASSEKLMAGMTRLMRRISHEEQGLRQNEQTLDKELVAEVLDEYLSPVVRRFSKKRHSKDIKLYLNALRDDLMDNIDQLVPQESQPPTLEQLQSNPDDFFVRCEVNIFVDNANLQGAPVVVEDHPTANNLLGCIERESEMGALVTDFTLVKAGALHRANGGVLVLHTEDLLQNPSAWEGLLRALRSGLARIEDQGDQQDQTKTKTIEPEPMPLAQKVVLVGTDDTYEMLLAHEDRFPKLFKIKAHLQETCDRNAAAVKNYCFMLSRIVEEARLLPFDRSALAGLVDNASRLAEDQKKLSLMLPLQRELMIEASALATAQGKNEVDADILAQASQARDYRSNLYEEEFMEHYDRELIRVATSGEAVGRVNGLSVSFYGDYEIGLPHHIACTVGVGEGGIVDLEREAQLGGPIHTKAMMILKSYLVAQFAQNKPIMLTGSLCFEQSYAHVEGDSASGAELAALLSALADVPVRHSLAFTGAVNQSGQIMAVGGVTRKIEGFFEVCRRKGLTGEQGVLLPVDNKAHLMLKDEVIQAVERGEFHIYSVSTIEEAMELLTGLPAGKRSKKGGYSQGTLFRLVDDRLEQLAATSMRFHAPRSGKRWPA